MTDQEMMAKMAEVLREHTYTETDSWNMDGYDNDDVIDVLAEYHRHIGIPVEPREVYKMVETSSGPRYQWVAEEAG